MVEAPECEEGVVELIVSCVCVALFDGHFQQMVCLGCHRRFVVSISGLPGHISR